MSSAIDFFGFRSLFGLLASNFTFAASSLNFGFLFPYKLIHKFTFCGFIFILIIKKCK